MKQLLILAGGKGTRLAPLIGDLPKALVSIDGRPLLHSHLDLAAEYGFDEVVLLVCHGADAIREACGDGGRWGLKIVYIEETEPRGTAGAVLGTLDSLADRFLVTYGDTMVNVDLDRIWRWHVERKADATLLVHPNDHPHDSDIVEIDQSDRVVAFHPYPHGADEELPNLVNGGLYVLERSSLLGRSISRQIYDFGKHLFPSMLSSGCDLRGYRTREYIKDAGTPERLTKVIADVKSGKVVKGSLNNLAPAVFLDRDGTINPDTGHIAAPDQFSLLPGADEAIKRLNHSDYLTAVITNQPVIARGEADEDTLQRIHNRMETLLGRVGAYVDAIYYCPHHPDGGFPGERAELKIACDCRKPGTALVERACADLGIWHEQSWLIGDTTVDLETARRSGLRSILVKTGAAGRDGKFSRRPDFECSDLSEAVSLIIDVWPRLVRQAEEILPSVPAASYVLIGGLARTGKSSLASALALSLRSRGRAAVVISLDGWLRDLDDRPPNGSVLDRYNIEAIGTFLAQLPDTTGDVDIPVYDRFTRSRSGSYKQSILRDDIVILEGVVALTLDLVCSRPIYRIFVDRPEQDRRMDFWREYEGRGRSTMQIAETYTSRAQDENSIVLDSRRTANKIVDSALS